MQLSMYNKCMHFMHNGHEVDVTTPAHNNYVGVYIHKPMVCVVSYCTTL